MIEGTTGESESKVPFLGDIPILGNLFKSSSNSDREKVLMMFIRPTIIRTPEDANKVSQSKFEHLKTLDFRGTEGSAVSKQLKEFVEQGQILDTTE